MDNHTMKETDNTTKWIRRSIILILALGIGGMLMLQFDGGCGEWGCQAGNGRPVYRTVDITVNDWPLVAHVVDTPEMREESMDLSRLPAPGHAILYVWSEPTMPEFWMKGKYNDVSVAFIQEDGRIVGIHQMNANDSDRVSPDVPIRYAIEVRQGFFEDHSVETGTVISLPEVLENNGGAAE